MKDKLPAYFEGELPPSEAAAVEAELKKSPELRRRLERYREIAGVLGRTEPELEALDLAAAVRRQRPPAPRRRWIWPVMAAAACLALFVALRPPEFRAKGAGDGSWAGISLHRVRDGRPVPVDGTVGSVDGVLVSYNNLGPHPYQYLMVFAVGEDGRVAWLHPGWERASEDPVSVAIQPGAAVELRTLIHPSWAAGRVTLHALFTHQPLRVRQVEAALPRLPDGFDEQLALTIE
jgi:hypothetical protein